MSQADRIRRYALLQYVEPARTAGHPTVWILAGDVCRGLGRDGRAPNVCSALQSMAFLRLADAQLLERTGPRQSTTTRFRYAIAQSSGNEARFTSTKVGPLGISSERRVRRRPTSKASHGRDLTVVIQCAASKSLHAGHFIDEHGKPILFVARPQEAPRNRIALYRHPDDLARDGRTWRDELLKYNCRREENPLGLLPAWRLYKNAVYSELIEAFGLDKVFILSAGWGLLAADFLIPNYDITFSNQAETYKRRRLGKDNYADFRMLPTERVGPIVFLGGKDYVGLFQVLTASSADKRVVFYNSALAPAAHGCSCIRFETTTRTNWHYECARALIAGAVDIPA